MSRIWGSACLTGSLSLHLRTCGYSISGFRDRLQCMAGAATLRSAGPAPGRMAEEAIVASVRGEGARIAREILKLDVGYTDKMRLWAERTGRQGNDRDARGDELLPCRRNAHEATGGNQGKHQPVGISPTSSLPGSAAAVCLRSPGFLDAFVGALSGSHLWAFCPQARTPARQSARPVPFVPGCAASTCFVLTLHLPGFRHLAVLAIGLSLASDLCTRPGTSEARVPSLIGMWVDAGSPTAI